MNVLLLFHDDYKLKSEICKEKCSARVGSQCWVKLLGLCAVKGVSQKVNQTIKNPFTHR